MWLWLSMIPGTTVRPRRSMTFVSGPWRPLDALPISAKRPSLIDTAETTVLSSSIVCILPLMNTVSGASFDGGRRPCFSSASSSLRAALLSIEPLAAAAAAAPWMALRQSDQAAFARRVDGAVLAAGREVDEDGVHVADVGWIADHVAERLQLGNLGFVEACFTRDEVSGRGHRDARRLDRLLERHVVIHQVDEHVVDRADDGGAAGRAEGGDRLASFEEDRRRHARSRALAAVASIHDHGAPALVYDRCIRFVFSQQVHHREVRGIATGVAHRLCGRKH